VIEVENMKVFAYHGCYKEEKIVGNNFRVWLRLEGDFSKAAETDNLHEAVDYQKAVGVVKYEMEITSDLLEHVAKRILDGLYEEFNNLNKATVKVSKLNPPVGEEVGSISVTLSQ